MVTLRPVIEVDTFSLCPHIPVPGSVRCEETQQEWEENWLSRLEDLRLSPELAIWPNSNMFFLEKIWGEVRLLRRILGEWLKDDDELLGEPTDDADFTSSLYGGVCVLVDGQAVVGPDCCGRLDNLEEWLNVAVSERDRGLLWTGHPGLFYYRNGEEFHFGVASDPPLSKHLPTYLESYPIEFSIHRDLLREQLERGLRVQEEFAKKLEPFVLEHYGQRSSAVCEALAGIYRLNNVLHYPTKIDPPRPRQSSPETL